MSALCNPVTKALEAILLWPNNEVSSRSNMLLNTIQHSELLISLACQQTICSSSINLCELLQSAKIDLCHALFLVESFTEELQKLRRESNKDFKSIYARVVQIAANHEIALQVPRVTARQ